MNNMTGNKASAFKQKLFAEITEIPDILKPSYLPGLDGLRGLSISIVIIGHFALYRGLLDYLNGEIGVQVFFVISGFLITTLLLKEKVKHKNVSLRKFYIRRFLRIVPVSYLYLIVVILLNRQLHLGVTLKSFTTAFLYLKNIPFKNATDWTTGHYWSLSVEEQFYLFFPFFIIFKCNKYLWLSILIIIFLPFLNILGFNNVGVFYKNHVIHFFTFSLIILLGKGTASILVGSTFSILLFKKIIRIENLPDSYFLSFLLLVFAFALLTRVSVFYYEFISVAIFPFLIGYIIVVNLRQRNFLSNVLENATIKKIGVLSYSLYVWQQIFTNNDRWNLFKYSDTIIVRLIMLVLVANISYHFFEKIFLRYKAKFKMS